MYAGGGGGFGTRGNGSGGLGGGGSNGLGWVNYGDGPANRGGGGSVFSNGGSGIVIISVPTASYTGITTGSPVVTTNGSNTIIKFNSSGSYTA
jgi:hypothetical protein